MLSESPKVSVIIPAYNVENYIGKAIQSVIDQTYKDLELIVVNDGSTDNTESEVSKYSNLDNVVIINQPNKGVSSARNNGLNKARGKWCLFLDGDDYLEPDLISKMVSIAEQFYMHTRNENVLIGTNCKFVDNKGTECFNRITQINEDIKDTIISSHDALCEVGTSKYILQSVWCKMFLTETIRANKICFDESFPNGEDGLFVFDYLRKASNLVFVNCRKWNILVREGSVTRSGFNDKLNSAILAIERMIKLAPDDEIELCLREYLVERTVSLESKYILSGGRNKELLNYYRSILRKNMVISGNRPVKKKILYFVMSYLPIFAIDFMLKLKQGSLLGLS